MKKRSVLSLILMLTMIFMSVSVFVGPQKIEAADKLVLTDNTNLTVWSFKNYLCCKAPGMTAKQVRDSFSGQNTNVYNKSGTIMADTAKVTTGCQIRLMGTSAALDYLTIIIGGDVDGNGSVNNTDLTKLKAAVKTAQITLKAEFFAAADTDMSGKLTVSDYIRIKRHVKGTYTISLVAPYERVEMPNVVGLTWTQAKAALNLARLKYNPTYDYSNTVPINTVISQGVTAGAMVMQGTTVNIVISLGKDPNNVYNPVNFPNNLRAVWLSQFDIPTVFYSNALNSFTTGIRTAMQRIKNSGFNTVFVQVRPNGDSFFPSEYYPLSKYVTGGSYSSTATKNYDALSVITEQAHSFGLSVHAWINPLRLMSATEITQINDKYPIKQWYNSSYYNGRYIVNYQGYYYLNPAYEAPRQLIIDGVAEICSKYDVDGIHFDDYFYPTTDASFDSEAFGNQDQFMLLGDFRRNNVTLMVKGCYDVVKANNANMKFGISPAGDPVTVQSRQYADINLWCSSSGYIDYIMPQLYYGFNNSSTPFRTYAQKWSNKTTSSSVKLYAGLALYKACEPSKRTTSDGTEWDNSTDILKREIEYLGNSLPKYKGVSAYSYGDLLLSAGATERDNMLAAMNSVYGG